MPTRPPWLSQCSCCARARTLTAAKWVAAGVRAGVRRGGRARGRRARAREGRFLRPGSGACRARPEASVHCALWSGAAAAGGGQRARGGADLVKKLLALGVDVRGQVRRS